LRIDKRKEGATLAEIAKATDWPNHSIRGFVSGHEEARVESRIGEERCGGANLPDRWLVHNLPRSRLEGAAFVVWAPFGEIPFERVEIPAR